MKRGIELWERENKGFKKMYISLLKLVRWFYSFLGLVNEPKSWRLFRTPITKVEELAPRLAYCGYYANLVSSTYKGQIYTARKLTDLDHQLHIRIYKDGWVTGHYELSPIHPIEHLSGIELRKLRPVEINGLRRILILEEGTSC